MLTQIESHTACMVGSGFSPHSSHCPPRQLAAVPQEVPHAPQSSPLLLKSTHCAFAPLPQTFRPIGQTQPLLTHVAPMAQVCPHSPQLFGSLDVYTHIKAPPASALDVALVVGPASSVSGAAAGFDVASDCASMVASACASAIDASAGTVVPASEVGALLPAL